MLTLNLKRVGSYKNRVINRKNNPKTFPIFSFIGSFPLKIENVLSFLFGSKHIMSKCANSGDIKTIIKGQNTPYSFITGAL